MNCNSEQKQAMSLNRSYGRIFNQIIVHIMIKILGNIIKFLHFFLEKTPKILSFWCGKHNLKFFINVVSTNPNLFSQFVEFFLRLKFGKKIKRLFFRIVNRNLSPVYLSLQPVWCIKDACKFLKMELKDYWS